MADLNPTEQIIMKALQELGATNEKTIKTADDIMKKSNRPKGLVTNALVELTKKGVIKRVAREKAAGYYILKMQ
ncbi:transcriptional regulator [Candidatus Marsarchaeota archaeon]|nr:transcriptional regulator [Candidatus Marsarchaeota archaeon]MCL5404629.1 transcriptional regulator [Candidatus Marsarchaeota archaeon]